MTNTHNKTRILDNLAQKTHAVLSISTVLAEKLDRYFELSRLAINEENEKQIILAYFELQNSIDTACTLANLNIDQLTELELELEELGKPKKDAVNS